MYKSSVGFVHSHAVYGDRMRGMDGVGRVAMEDLPRALSRFRRLTVLISQRNRGGLNGWPRMGFSPDIVVVVEHGDEVAEAVRICSRGNQMYGWPVLCLVMGATHAYARIEAAAKAARGSGVQVLVVEGR